jgi:hypothetical protein
MLVDRAARPTSDHDVRHVLHNLRRALPNADRHLDIMPRMLHWRPDTVVRLDLAELEAALDRAGAADDLETAAQLYASDLLEGISAERLLRLQPLPETYQRLIRLHDVRGDRARALRAHDACGRR